jgi:plastocyanin
MGIRKDSNVRSINSALVARVKYAALAQLCAGSVIGCVLGGLLVMHATDLPRIEDSAPTPTEQSVSSPIAAAQAAPPAEDVALPTAEPTAFMGTGGRVSPPARAPRRPTPAAPAVTPTAASVPTMAQVLLSDMGVYPKSVSIRSGGTVQWKNSGSDVHTATRLPGAGYALDTGGLVTGDSYSMAFNTPGIYRYTSATDCFPGGRKSSFDCSGGVIDVVPSAAGTATLPSTAAPSVKPSPLVDVTAVTVAINDGGFVPDQVSIRVGQAITWVNNGVQVHSATAVANTGPKLDTGGLSHGQSAQMRFSSAGNVAYTSAPDCLNGNRSHSFNCSKSFVVSVQPLSPASPVPS